MKHNKHKNIGIFIVLEIIQLGFVLFVSASVAAYGISWVFKKIDSKINEIENSTSQTVVNLISLYTQLIITAVAYYYIEKLTKAIPSISNILNKNYVSHQSSMITTHIFLIIVIVEMNSSLKAQFHHMAALV